MGLKKSTTIVSLLEIVTYLSDVFKTHKVSLNYNSKHFLIALLNEIFCNIESSLIDEISVSTKILINDGLSEEIALEIASRCYKMLIDIIVSINPSIKFSDSKNYIFELYGNYDLLLNKIN